MTIAGALAVVAVIALVLVYQAGKIRDLEEALAESEHGLSERMKTAERETRALSEAVGALKEALSSVKHSVEEIHGDMKEHDDSFEKFLEGMGNLMNYSYQTAMDSQRPEDKD